MGIPIYPLLVSHQARIAQFNLRMSEPLRPAEVPEDGAARARYAQQVFDREEAQAGLFTALGEATDVSFTDSLSDEFGDGGLFAPCPGVERAPKLVVQVELRSSHDVPYTSPCGRRHRTR